MFVKSLARRASGQVVAHTALVLQNIKVAGEVLIYRLVENLVRDAGNVLRRTGRRRAFPTRQGHVPVPPPGTSRRNLPVALPVASLKDVTSLPLNGGGRLAGDVQDYAVEVSDPVSQSWLNPSKQKRKNARVHEVPDGHFLNFRAGVPVGFGELCNGLIRRINVIGLHAVRVLGFIFLNVLAPCQGEVKQPSERVFNFAGAGGLGRPYRFSNGWHYFHPAFRLMF